VYRGSQLSTISFFDFTSNHLEVARLILSMQAWVGQLRSVGQRSASKVG
jgi:hypothetical protein